MLTVTQLNCLRCSYVWLPRTVERPIKCPKCQSPYWNKMRRVPTQTPTTGKD